MIKSSGAEMWVQVLRMVVKTKIVERATFEALSCTRNVGDLCNLKHRKDGRNDGLLFHVSLSLKRVIRF